jgi:hypothetical protein
VSSQSRIGAPSSSNSGSSEASDAAREARRAARQAWPLHRYDLGAEPGDDLTGHTTAVERLAKVRPLNLVSWRLAGRPIPQYERARMPGRIVRSGAAE